jgi:hypothetical protein
MKRWIVPVVAVVALLGAAVVFRRELAAWFGGERGRATSESVRAQAGNLTVEAALRPDPPREKGNTLEINVADAAGRPVEGSAVTVTHVMLAMGSMPEMRGTASVSNKGGGRYEARFDLPMRGSWTLDIAVDGASARLQMTVGTPGLRALGGGGSRPAAIDEPVVPPTELPAAALDAVRRAFDATERGRAELAFDRLDGVAAPAREAAQAIRAAQSALPTAGSEVANCLGQGVAAVEQLANAPDLDAARLAFGELNRFLIALAAADPRLQDGWHVFSCPMAKGFKKWIQKSATLENPYMGRAMPTCGGSGTWGVARRDDSAGLSHDGHDHSGDDVSHYTCSMHPSVRRDQPGTCPICSMDLSPVTYDEEESGVIMIDEARRGQVGIRTGKVVKTPMTRSIRAVGRVAYDETRLRDVTLKLGGWITKLHVERTGQPVTRGQLLFTLYSPELYAAQQEYLLAKASHVDGGRGDYLITAAERKLQLWGLSKMQIAAIAKRGEPLEDMPFYSPAGGYVIEKDVVEGGCGRGRPETVPDRGARPRVGRGRALRGGSRARRQGPARGALAQLPPRQDLRGNGLVRVSVPRPSVAYRARPCRARQPGARVEAGHVRHGRVRDRPRPTAPGAGRCHRLHRPAPPRLRRSRCGSAEAGRGHARGPDRRGRRGQGRACTRATSW